MVFFSSRCEMNETVFKALCGRFVIGEQAIMLIYLYSCQHPSLSLSCTTFFSLLVFLPFSFSSCFTPNFFTHSFKYSFKYCFTSRYEFLYYFLKVMPKIKIKEIHPPCANTKEITLSGIQLQKLLVQFPVNRAVN